jgi:hypothetical protein
MFGTLKLYFFILLVLGAVGGVAYLYYTDTQARLTTAANENATMKIQEQIQKTTIAKLNADIVRGQEQLAKLRDEFSKFRKDYESLEGRFNKRSRHFGTRDIGKLAEVKPTAIERIINNATKDALRCFEIAAGSPLTHDEIGARKKSQTNKECPSIANPNYVEED